VHQGSLGDARLARNLRNNSLRGADAPNVFMPMMRPDFLRLGLPFEEGGQLHPPPDIAKMHSAHPLDDREQWSWLEKIAAWIDSRRQLGTGGVITSFALKRSHRDFLTRGRPDVRIVYLHGERALIASRLVAREEHSMLPTLLDHQFSIMEAPEPDEDPILIDVSPPVEDIVAEILPKLTPQGARESTGRCGPGKQRATRSPACHTVWAADASKH
jgi:gluconokinase